MDYEKEILVHLMEKYYNSKKDSGDNVLKRRTIIEPAKKLYSKYNQNDADIPKINQINRAADNLRRRGFITCEYLAHSEEIIRIILVDERKTDIEQYLLDEYGIVPKSRLLEDARRVIDTYKNSGPVSQAICDRMGQRLEKNRVPSDYQKTEEVLKALRFLENNSQEMYQRELSILVYGTSKYLEENVCQNLCKEIRAFYHAEPQEGEMPDEILERYHVYKEPKKVFLKGPIRICANGSMTDITCMRGGVELSYDQLTQADRIEIKADTFMTVENLTSFLRCADDTIAYFFLSGQMNRFQSWVLKKIYVDNPDIKYCHFGDIDAGGFIIHDNLCSKTGIPFALWHMGVTDLTNPSYRACLQKLTENDKVRLNKLAENVVYEETIRYMLKNNCKLEQEVVSWMMENDRKNIH